MIVYQGPSQLDGSPIVAIVTGYKGKKSKNAKTGAMLQTWILRADVDPLAASKTGADVSNCGQCPRRRYLGGDCYVALHQAPLSTWRKFQRGTHPVAADAQALAALGRGRMVRLGSYGDPAAVPAHVWEALTSEAQGRTGYTHQWRTDAGRAVAHLCMASVDSEAERAEAHAAGFRTFRVRGVDSPILPGEFTCPASKEAGVRTDCAACQACSGTSAHRGTRQASPVIIVHGALARRFANVQARIAA